MSERATALSLKLESDIARLGRNLDTLIELGHHWKDTADRLRAENQQLQIAVAALEAEVTRLRLEAMTCPPTN